MASDIAFRVFMSRSCMDHGQALTTAVPDRGRLAEVKYPIHGLNQADNHRLKAPPVKSDPGALRQPA